MSSIFVELKSYLRPASGILFYLSNIICVFENTLGLKSRNQESIYALQSLV